MYLNVFRSRKRADHDHAAYQADGARMDELARARAGFVDYKTFAAEDGETVTISLWESEAAAKAWAADAEHRAAQARGRADYYETYTMYTCAEAKETVFERGGA